MGLASPAKLPLVQAIVPALRSAAFNDPAWLFEPKYDGFRGLVYLSGKSCTLYSKKRNVFSRFDELRRDICAELPRAEVILDGEIVAIDDEGRIDFWGLMRGQGHVHWGPTFSQPGPELRSTAEHKSAPNSPA
jgi:bifunctional non-homologous end joining protein LigD